MKYEDVLATCLDRMRRGESIDTLVAEFPRFAVQLRADLTTAASSRGLAARLPATSSDARVRFQRDLQAQRRAVASKPQRTGGWFRLSLALPVGAAMAAALLAVAVLAGGVLAPTGTAEASIEGVILDNDGSTMTLQTDSGLQTVSVEQAQVTCADASSCIGPGSLEPGQLILIRATREATSVVARRIELRAFGEVANWCDRLPAQCAEVERLLAQRADRCEQNPVLCQRIEDRLRQIRSEIASRDRLSDLRNRCEAGTTVACRELQNACQSGRPACAPMRDFLRNRPQR
ncbi:MAG: hypothetical protein AB7T32_16195 [Dehalococcoidia bacterium]